MWSKVSGYISRDRKAIIKYGRHIAKLEDVILIKKGKPL